MHSKDGRAGLQHTKTIAEISPQSFNRHKNGLAKWAYSTHTPNLYTQPIQPSSRHLACALFQPPSRRLEENADLLFAISPFLLFVSFVAKGAGPTINTCSARCSAS
jgi:hypothetical protein